MGSISTFSSLAIKSWGSLPSGEAVYDAEARGLVKQIFHLEETELLVADRVDEVDLDGGDGVELFEVVGEYDEVKVFVHLGAGRRRVQGDAV